MARNVKPEPLVELDLSGPVFQTTWSDLELAEQEKVFATFKKLTQLTWNHVYLKPPEGGSCVAAKAVIKAF